MAVLDDIVIVAPELSPAEMTADDIKDSIKRQMWAYLYAHQDVILLSRKVLFWNVNLRVRDLFPFFERLFGEPE
jgi:hypothetical protein